METTPVRARSFIEAPEEKYIRNDIEQDPQAFVMEKLTSSKYNFGVDEIMRHGIYKEMGYKYDLRAYVRHFVYKQYGSWHESYALNRTNLRKLIRGHIDQILEA